MINSYSNGIREFVSVSVVFDSFSLLLVALACSVPMESKRRRTVAADVTPEALLPSLRLLITDGRKLSQTLWPLTQESWKTRPKLSILLRFATFYKSVFELVPSGVLRHLIVAAAITALDEVVMEIQMTDLHRQLQQTPLIHALLVVGTGCK